MGDDIDEEKQGLAGIDLEDDPLWELAFDP